MADSCNFVTQPSFSHPPEAIYGQTAPELLLPSSDNESDPLSSDESVNGGSMKETTQGPVGPFKNRSIFLSMDWALNVCHVAKGASSKIINKLVNNVLFANDFKLEDLINFQF
uniref:Uncharacterized protein n=1 Tax=Moniliophthora roreri TaxID=221103 RepID=A0A0W0FVL0_MONRR